VLSLLRSRRHRGEVSAVLLLPERCFPQTRLNEKEKDRLLHSYHLVNTKEDVSLPHFMQRYETMAAGTHTHGISNRDSRHALASTLIVWLAVS